MEYISFTKVQLEKLVELVEIAIDEHWINPKSHYSDYINIKTKLKLLLIEKEKMMEAN